MPGRMGVIKLTLIANTPWGAQACWSALGVLVSASAWQEQVAAAVLEKLRAQTG